jgi:hypothetical protein
MDLGRPTAILRLAGKIAFKRDLGRFTPVFNPRNPANREISV